LTGEGVTRAKCVSVAEAARKAEKIKCVKIGKSYKWGKRIHAVLPATKVGKKKEKAVEAWGSRWRD